MPAPGERATIAPTTAADVAEFFPAALPWRIRALTIRAGGKIICIGGISYLPDGTIIAFMESSEADCRRFPVTFTRGAKMICTMVDALGIRRLIASADSERAAAPRFLDHIGFRFAGIAGGQTIYVRE